METTQREAGGGEGSSCMKLSCEKLKHNNGNERYNDISSALILFLSLYQFLSLFLYTCAVALSGCFLPVNPLLWSIEKVS